MACRGTLPERPAPRSPTCTQRRKPTILRRLPHLRSRRVSIPNHARTVPAHSAYQPLTAYPLCLNPSFRVAALAALSRPRLPQDIIASPPFTPIASSSPYPFIASNALARKLCCSAGRQSLSNPPLPSLRAVLPVADVASQATHSLSRTRVPRRSPRPKRPGRKTSGPKSLLTYPSMSKGVPQ